MLTKKLIELEDKIKCGKLPYATDLWGGADVIITDKSDDIGKGHERLVIDINGIYNTSDKIVFTKNAYELSQAFYELKDIFNDFIDAGNKYTFYGNLASAAIESCKLGDGINVLLDTVKEAKLMASDIESKYSYYFAYGSNMDETQMKQRCPSAEKIDRVYIDGYRFLINERGVATIVRDLSKAVHGVLWLIRKEDENSMDRYEGVGQCHYFKTDFDTLSIDNPGKSYYALAYVAYNCTPGKPRDGYLDRVTQAARMNGLKEEYIKNDLLPMSF